MWRVSVIIPTYNRAELLVEALQSVLSQSHAAEEIIIVDDGSEDDTRVRLAPFMGSIRYFMQPNRGVSAARNTGLSHATCDWIAFLDSDDLWLPKKLQKQLDFLRCNPKHLICYTDEEWRRHGLWRNQGKKHRKYSGWIYEQCLPLCIISPSSVILHRQVFESVGLFDESLPVCEDYDFWLRTCARFPVLFLPQRLIVKRAGNWRQLSQQHSLDRHRIIALEKMLQEKISGSIYRQATLAMMREKYDIYKAGCVKHQRSDELHWLARLGAKYGYLDQNERH